MNLKQRLRVAGRLSRLSGHIFQGFVTILVYRLHSGSNWYRTDAGQRCIQRWMQRLNLILGLKVQLEGRLSPAPSLLVANHISWLDIPALASISRGAFVAKSDVRAWPMLGALARQSGTLFITRNSLSGMRALMEELQRLLRQGITGIVFPEGTSTDGSEVKPFFPAMFQAAIGAEVPVQALAIRYVRDGERDGLAPFVGDDSFLPHLLRILCEPETRVYIEFAQPMTAQGYTRQWAAKMTQCWVERKIIARPRKHRLPCCSNA